MPDAGHVIATVLEDPYRFEKSPTVGAYQGLVLPEISQDRELGSPSMQV